LQSVVEHNPGQKTNILELQDLVTVRLGLDPDKMAAGATNQPDPLAISLTEEGKTTMDHINRVLFKMSQDEENMLDSHQQRTEAEAISNHLTTVVLICAVAVALLFIIFIVVRLEKLQQVVTICAWTGQVKFEGEWIRLEEYLKKRFGISVSHGLSREAAEKMAKEIELARRTNPASPSRN